MDINGIDLLLKRTNLINSFFAFQKKLIESYPEIGKIIKIEPILEGYEDANFIILTDKGKYALKIFLFERSETNIKDYTKVLITLDQIGVPSLKLVKGREGFLSSVKSGKNKTYYFLTRFFEGDNFVNTPPLLTDMLQVAKFLALINTIEFAVEETYDSWGNKNLLKEFKENYNKLNTDELLLINPVIKTIKKLDFSKFSQSFIHGDMQRKHVLKNKKEEYCVFDFGCMANGPKIIDLSTYLAWFCLAKNNWNQQEKIVKEVVEVYKKFHKLTQYEFDSLIPLTQASWAAYFLKTSVLIKEGDNSTETKDWHDQSENMLELSKDWQLKFN